MTKKPDLDSITVRVEFGPMVPMLWEQLRGFELTGLRIDRFQSYADALVRLQMGDLLTDTELTRARRRLLGLIKESILETRDTPAPR